MIETILIFSSIIEVLLIIIILFLFFKLKRSESLLSTLQEKQRLILDKLRFNAELEKKLIDSFEARQKELIFLDRKLQEKVNELRGLVKCAEDMINSPQLLKEAIIKGYRNGESVEELCKKTGLSREEVELIIDQYS